METFTCPDRCCTIKIKPYIHVKDPFEKIRRRRKKAGVFLYDPRKDKVLLIQSRGHLWGPPKGSMNYEELEIDCATREVYEETGIEIDTTKLTNYTNIHNRATYFYSEMDECDVNVQDGIRGNDANGIGWIKPDCLEKCIENGNISLTQHCRLAFIRFQNRFFPQSTFILVKTKKCSSRFESHF